MKFERKDRVLAGVMAFIQLGFLFLASLALDSGKLLLFYAGLIIMIDAVWLYVGTRDTLPCSKGWFLGLGMLLSVEALPAAFFCCYAIRI